MNKRIVLDALEMAAVVLSDCAQVNHPDRIRVLRAVLDAIREIKITSPRN